MRLMRQNEVQQESKYSSAKENVREAAKRSDGMRNLETDSPAPQRWSNLTCIYAARR